MRRLYLLLSIMALTLMFTLLMFLQPGAAAEELQRVILINVEGFNYEGYISTPMHNFRQMADEGVLDEKCLALRTDSIEAALASLLTGALPEQHGYYDRSSGIGVESLLAVLQKQGRTFQIIDGSGGKLQGFNYGDDKYTALKPDSRDHEAVQRVTARIPDGLPFFTLIYLNDSMEALLSMDDTSYYDALMSFDNSLGDMVNHLKNNNMYDDSLIMITSVRSTSPSDLVPLLIHGPGCRSGIRTSSVMALDTCATICSFMGISAPAASLGIPVYDAMTVRDEDKNYVNVKWIADLKKERIAQWGRYYENQDELYRTIHQMTSIKEERQNIYHFAGEKEKIIEALQSRISWQRGMGCGILLLVLSGYLLEYRWLKKKFMLFK
jgi:hypothetical protein